MRNLLLPAFVFLLQGTLSAQNVQVTISILKDRRPVSPFIYGRNNSLSDDPSSPLSSANWQLYKDAGLNFFRENGGNNLTKYNWRLKLTSHPDWYNNVYGADWDYAAQSLHSNLPAAQGMWGFQLIGQAASNTSHNFDDWDFNGSQWWTGVNQNLAGGGTPNTAGGSQALVNGNPSLYLEPWQADSTTGVLSHWFGNGGLGLDSSHIRYWNMDNEVEIWSGTHDDIMPTQPTAEAFLQSYFAVAKKARSLFPGIRLTGPVSPNEWQWYNWNNATITGTDGKQYPWLQYFIKRVAEEEQASGIRLLDVIDLHFYPSSTDSLNIVQYHRVFFDSTYNFPEANGVKNVNGSWNNSIQIEDIFGRAQNWLNQYMGPDNGVGFGISEAGLQIQNKPNSLAVWYASTMGEFMKHGVEFFAPWYWDYGQWETLHLFSRYNKNFSVQALSGDEQDVSAYATVDNSNDSMTVVLVNRLPGQSKTITLNFPDFQLANHAVTTLALSGLPAGKETFLSHTNNALKTGSVNPQLNNTLQVTIDPMSVTSLQISGASAVLPLTLIDFTAARNNQEADLAFSVTNEDGLASFAVERSADGSSYTPVGMVMASGAKTYSFVDHQPLSPLNYYRLKIIYQDGHSTYSKIDTVRFGSSPTVRVWPNPANDQVYVEWTLPAGPALLQIVDATGRVVMNRMVQASGLLMTTTVDIAGLARGSYYVRAGQEVLNFVKK
jgi:hypothetical protein